MKTALVVGGNGFIGQHLVSTLLSTDWSVTVYDRAATSRVLDLKVAPEYVQGELGNRELLHQHLGLADVVFHLASTTIPKTSNDDPTYDVLSNVVPTVDLFTECVRVGVPRVVFISSGGTVYGVPEQLPVPETHPTRPICSYGITKLTIEHYLRMFWRLYGLRYSIIRPSNPYGEYQNYLGEQGAIAVFLGCIATGKPITLWGDGSVIRDYLHVADLARACVLAAETEIPDLVVNVGSGEGHSLRDVLQIIRETIDCEFDVQYATGRPFDVPRLILDVSRARFDLGWTPHIDLSEGVARTWNWINERISFAL